MVLVICLLAIGQAFAKVEFDSSGAVVGSEATGVFNGAVSIICFCAGVFSVLALGFLGLSTMLGITIGKDLKQNLIRIFGGAAIVFAAGYVATLIGFKNINTGGNNNAGAVILMTAEAFKALTLII